MENCNCLQQERMEQTKRKYMDILDETEEENLLIVGDFNASIGERSSCNI